MRPLLYSPFLHEHYGSCWEQPGKQEWHLLCALLHPFRFARSRGPRQWRYGGPA